jgi:signal transduction histidine kinase/streptogramin lyase
LLPLQLASAVYYGHLDHGEQVWIATSVGLFIVDPETETVDWYRNDPDNPASLPENSVRHLYKDREGNVWLATYGGGVARAMVKNEVFKTFQHSPKNANSVVAGLLFGICEDKNGSLWIASEDNGISQYILQERRFITHLYNPNNPHTPCADYYRALFCDSDGNLWANHSVYNPTTKQWRRFLPQKPYLSYPNRVLTKGYIEIGDTMYAFYEEKICAVHRQTLQFSLFRIEIPGVVHREDASIQCVFKNRRGQIFIGTRNGFAELDIPSRQAKQWRLQHPNPSSMGYGYIQAIYQTNDGRYWVGTRGGGLFIFDEHFERIEHQSTRNGFPDDVIYDILEDDNGLLWLTTNNGLLQVDPKTMLVTRHFTDRDGLPNNEFNHHCFTKLTTGEFAGGGLGGFFIFNPKHLKPDTTTLSVALTDFKVFEKSFPFDTSILYKHHIMLDYAQNFFAFSFAACSYKNPDAIEYAYMLEGIDKTWIETQSATARYNSVPHGTYRFLVKARLGKGRWGEPREILLTLTPPFWRTTWFIVGVSLALIILTVLAVSAIIRRKVEIRRQEELKRAREVTILAERERISADMHDDIGSALTKIAIIAEELKRQQNAPLDTLDRLANTAREATAGVSAIVWSMNPRYDTIESFAAYLREKSRQLFEYAPIHLTIDFPETLPPLALSGEARHNLFLAVKEALNNVLKHSHASQAHLSMSLEGSVLTIVVQDNGIGRAQTETFGNGLRLMQKRLKKNRRRVLDCVRARQRHS